MCDISEIEGRLEKIRKDLALRTDFNICDVYKLFIGKNTTKKGIDCDDFYIALVHNLQLEITKDEMFILFYKLDTNGDAKLTFSEICNAFSPQDKSYATIMQSRGGFYGAESNPLRYFEGPTRQGLRDFLRTSVDNEMSIELIR